MAPLTTATPPPVPLTAGTTILGIDPGLEALGWGVAVVAPDGQLYYRAHGALHTLAAQSMPVRVDQLSIELQRLCTQYRPDVLAVEAWVPYGGRTGAGGNTMRVCGVIRALGIYLGIPVVEYTAQAVKGLAMGNRNSDKAGVQAAMQTFFALPKLPRPNHAADALACTVAHYRANSSAAEVTSKSVAPRVARKRVPRG